VIGIKDTGDGSVDVRYESQGSNHTLRASLVIGADGASSTVGKLFLPETERKYAGYVIWRGTVQATLISEATRERLEGKSTFFASRGNQVTHYVVPGLRGSLERDDRLFNFAWYCNYAPGSKEHKDLLTDTSGILHHFSVPRGKLQPEIVAAKQKLAETTLPPQLVEVFQKVKNPFVQAITDNLTEKAVFLDGKVILVGDAVSGLRPHTGGGISQSAIHALMLARVFGDDPTMNLDQWEKEILAWAAETQKLGQTLGQMTLFGKHPMADDE